MKHEKTYTVAQAAEMLNVKPVTVYRWIENGTCKSLRVRLALRCCASKKLKSNAYCHPRRRRN